MLLIHFVDRVIGVGGTVLNRELLRERNFPEINDVVKNRILPMFA